MKHVWAKTNQKFEIKVYFKYRLTKDCNILSLSAGPFYTVFFDGKLVSYGPERTAEGFSRIRNIHIPKGTKEIKVLVLSYGCPSLDTDFFEPFFGAELYYKDQIVATADNFLAFESSKHDNRSFKYSFQRGFGERFNLSNINEQQLITYEVENPTLIGGIGDTCLYKEQKFNHKKEFIFKGFDSVKIPNYLKDNDHPEFYSFNVEKEFVDEINGYICNEYELAIEKSGLIKLKINAQEDDTKIFVVFDEYLDNGKWIFGRSSCMDLITVESNKGQNEVVTSTVYSLKHLRILTNKKCEVVPSLILIQNDTIKEIKETGNKKLDLIIKSARETFIQNSVDIYTDCPGRERGGWLCDGYFMSMAESFFAKNNNIEKQFLENFIIARYDEIEEGMLPMVFPSQESLFIPNWSMWFVLELENYFKKTNDKELVNAAKEKIYKLIHYFEKFENEYRLLENLNGWVFVEWSEAGTEDYVKGLSFPTNMLYSSMLRAAGELFRDNNLLNKAQEVASNINKLSFNGKVYVDNAVRENGKLILQKNHTSETCQYYALFFGISNDKHFIEFVKNELGPNRKDTYPEIARSNSFIGNYLRFLWLKSIGEKEKVYEESIDYFYTMASYSGTLWEKNIPTASCNHGFASSIAAILLN